MVVATHLLFPLYAGFFALYVARLVLSYRHASGVQRQQLKLAVQRGHGLRRGPRDRRHDQGQHR